MTDATRARALRWGSFVTVLGVVLLYATGLLHGGRVQPGAGQAFPSEPAPAGRAVAERVVVPVVEEAVGTVRSRREVTVAAQTIARVVTVGAHVGDTVRAGDELVHLDDAAVAARFTQAAAQYERTRRFAAAKAATTEQLEAAEATYREAKAAIDHTRITAPFDGVVAERHVEPGDLASPGRPLLVLLDPSSLRVEARVREGLVGRLAVGARLPLVVPAAGLATAGSVAAVLPSADAQSRTFEVRVDFDAAAGVHPGMFARLRMPTGEHEVVRVPAAAIVRVGQMETALVEENGAWRRRLVTTGRAFDDGKVEVLSGLGGGETVGLPAAAGAP